MGLKDAKREKPAQEEAIRDTGNIETAQAVENKKHQKKSKSASDLGAMGRMQSILATRRFCQSTGGYRWWECRRSGISNGFTGILSGI